MSNEQALEKAVYGARKVLLKSLESVSQGLFFPELDSFIDLVNKSFILTQDNKKTAYVVVKDHPDKVEIIISNKFLDNLKSSNGIALAKIAILHEYLEIHFQNLDNFTTVIEKYPEIINTGYPSPEQGKHNEIIHCVVNLYLEKLFATNIPSKEILEKVEVRYFPLFHYDKVVEDIKNEMKEDGSIEDTALAAFTIMIAHLKIIGTRTLYDDDVDNARRYLERTFALKDIIK